MLLQTFHQEKISLQTQQQKSLSISRINFILRLIYNRWDFHSYITQNINQGYKLTLKMFVDRD